MSEEILLGGKTYVSSKRAARECGYAQDYVGQLARTGVIDAQRVGGLWYVAMDSLQEYKRNSDTQIRKPPAPVHAPEIDTVVSFDGKDYISAARASKITGYNPDYVGQLARGGKVLSRQIGNRWYVERDGLLAHKNQKDSMLARVQAEAVGLTIPTPAAAQASLQQPEGPYFTYIREDDHLMPVLRKPDTSRASHGLSGVPTELSQRVPIRVMSKTVKRPVPMTRANISRKSVRSSGISMSGATKAVTALTVVIVLSYGFASIKNESLYAFVPRMQDQITAPAASMTAGAVEAFESFVEYLETLVSPPLEYSRD